MPYCVKCGVELDASAKACALCKTRVILPEDLPTEFNPTPYPEHAAAHLSKKEKRYTAQILSIILLALSAVCVIVNFFYGGKNPWAVYPIGAFILVYSLFVPALLFKWHPYVFLSADVLVLLAYLYAIEQVSRSVGWFGVIAVPTVLGLYMMIMVVVWIYELKHPAAFIMNALISVAVGMLSLIIDAVVHRYIVGQFYVSWSLISASCCIALALALWATYRNIKLRSEVQKRLHM